METSHDTESGDREIALGTARALRRLVEDMRTGLARLCETARDAPLRQDELVEQRLRGTLARAEALAGKLLAYAGAQTLVPVRLEILPFLCDFAFRLRLALDVRIAVSVEVGHDCPACHVDSGGLEEALMGLVINARDAMPEGGRLQFRAEREVAPGGGLAVALSVADSGRGMAADFLPRAARPFVTTETLDPLSGLGLAAAEGFARQSGGRLTMRSWVGGGFAATLHLPQALIEKEAALLRDPAS